LAHSLGGVRYSIRFYKAGGFSTWA